MVKISFKIPSSQQPLVLDVNTTTTNNIEKLKILLGNETNTQSPLTNIKLIHKGKILKDDTELSTLSLSDGESMHAVIKKAEGEKQSTSTSNNTSSTNNNSSNNNNSSSNQNPFGNMGGMGGLGGMGGMGGLGGLGGMGGMGGLGGLGGMGGMGGLGNMDPNMMAAMMQNITPQMMEQIINSNPMLKGMVDSNPQLKAIFSNPALMQQMMNPETIRQAMQMQNLYGGGMGGMGGMGGQGGLGGLGGFGGLGGLGGLGGFGQQQQGDPKEIYKNQLQQLQGMGFTNESVNIEALKATGGNVEAAVQRLLNMLN